MNAKFLMKFDMNIIQLNCA